MIGLINTNKVMLAKAYQARNVLFRSVPHKYFNPLPYQLPFWESKKKDRTVLGGNRSGKTENVTVYEIKKCLDNPGFDCWAATWADMSVPVQQKKFFEKLPKDQTIKYASFSEQRGFTHKIIMFANGSKIRFKTYEQGRESFQGTSKDIILLDEEAPEDIVSECKARLIDRNGEMIRSMTPLDGITYTYDQVVLNEGNDPEVVYWFWDSSLNTYVNQDALQRIINGYPSKEAEVRNKGHFLNLTTGNAYYTFSDDNIINSYLYKNYLPLEVSCDFNIDLMCWNIGQEDQGVDFVFDFVEVENQANTEFMCNELLNKFPQHEGGFIFYGDIAGDQRHPESSRTNWAIIREYFPNASINYQNIRNIKDRIDSFNARVKNNNNI